MLALDEGEQLGQGGLALVDRLAEDHLPQQEQRLVGARAVEHVLGAEQPDAFGAEVAGDLGVFAACRRWCARPACGTCRPAS